MNTATAAAQTEYNRRLKSTRKAAKAWSAARDALRAADSNPDTYRVALGVEQAAHDAYNAASAYSMEAYKILSACWDADRASRS